MNLKPEELVKALRCCAEGECSGCPMYADKQRCQEQTLASSADQIERDQKEIAELKAKVEQLSGAHSVVGDSDDTKGGRMKIYIAGKITGDPDYRAKFADAQRQIEAQGHIVLNPASLPEGMEPKDYMRICFAMIDVADEVRFLPDFLFSIGAHIEHTYSKYCGKRCVRSVDGKEI